MEKRGEQLDLGSAGAELVLAAAVHLDSVGGAELVQVEELGDASEPRGLDVDRARPLGKPADFLRGRYPDVPADARGGDDDGRVLEHRIGVEGERRLDGSSVAACLEVDDVHR